MLTTLLFNPISTHIGTGIAGMVGAWFILRKNPKLLRIDLGAAAAAVKAAALNQASGK